MNKIKSPGRALALAALALLSTLNSQLSTLRAQGTAFTYQGRLNVNGSPANGSYDLTFNLYNASSGGSPVTTGLTNPAVTVASGLFTTGLDFGAGVFNGTTYWLEIGARTNGSGPFVTLVNRQQLTPSPYAIFAESAGGVANNAITGPSIASGTVVRSLNGLSDTVTLSAGANVNITPSGNSLQISATVGAADWALTGNLGTAADNFLGTLDPKPLEMRVNNVRALRLEPSTATATPTPNIIGGASVNNASPGIGGATIAGGGIAGFVNTVTADFGTVSGGYGNTSGPRSTVGGGSGNTSSGSVSVVGGGGGNTASGGSSTVGGGVGNTSSGSTATVVGGANNTSSGDYGVVGGGLLNAASGAGAFVGGGGYDGFNRIGNIAGGVASTVAGGLGNSATNQYSTMSGGQSNISGGAFATLGGGRQNVSSQNFTTVGGGLQNISSSPFSTVAGGYANTSSGLHATVAGGYGNQAYGPDAATVSGGYLNVASNYAATVSGGQNNVALGTHAVIGGGYFNTANGDNAVAGGGANNTAVGQYASVLGGQLNSASGDYSMIPGGSGNTASGVGSFAAGINAHANDIASFVWGDGSAAANSTGPNTFAVKATGGVGFYVNTSSVNITPNGSVGIGTASPSQALEVNGEFLKVDGLGSEQAYFGGDGVGGDVQIGSLNPSISAVACWNAANNSYMHLYCSSITIEGGADLAEPFQITATDSEIPRGTVVVIDGENPGHLKMSDRPYDTRVAGVVSGANGINPGIQMQQKGLLEGGENIALTGRVYVQADTSGGPIKPGDLLTTSEIPGHAMKVTDHAKAQGAIIGKAMSPLTKGKGIVLVLVTLQ